MSVIEFAWLNLGHNVARREYNDVYGYTETVYKWVEGCGPSGEIGIKACIVNVSDKEINGVTLVCEPLDFSGDTVGKEVKLQFTTISKYDKRDLESETYVYRGLKSEEKERIWVAPTAQKLNIKQVFVLYSDGTEEIINGKDVSFMGAKDSGFDKMREELAKEKELKKQKQELKKQKQELEKQEKEKQEENSRKSRGIVAYAGKIDGKDYQGESCKIETIGDVVFYIEKSNYGFHLIGWESKKAITHLELPSRVRGIKEECLKNTSIKSVTFPRTMKSISYNISGRTDLNLGINRVEKIVIPKETVEFSARYCLLGSIEEIEFEDPCGWGVSKKIITDPKKMYEYFLESEYGVTLKKSNSIIRKILYKLGF